MGVGPAPPAAGPARAGHELACVPRGTTGVGLVQPAAVLRAHRDRRHPALPEAGDGGHACLSPACAGLLGLAFTAKVMTMVHAERGRTDSVRETTPGSAGFAENLRNLLETGSRRTTSARRCTGAATSWERSSRSGRRSRSSRDREECRVRINLALAVEALGDRALAEGLLAEARSAWRTALRHLEAGDCALESADAVGLAAPPLNKGLARSGRGRLRENSTSSSAAHERAAGVGVVAELLARLNERAERIRVRAEQRRRDKADRAEIRRSSIRPIRPIRRVHPPITGIALGRPGSPGHPEGRFRESRHRRGLEILGRHQGHLDRFAIRLRDGRRRSCRSARPPPDVARR